MRGFVVSDADGARIDKWAAQQNKGGWQHLCARLKDGEVYRRFSQRDLRPSPAQAELFERDHVREPLARLEVRLRQLGIKAAIENLQALLAAEEDEGEYLGVCQAHTGRGRLCVNLNPCAVHPFRCSVAGCREANPCPTHPGSGL